MRGEAEFCSENKNRFLLKREWSKSKKKVLYIMFNPSNADQTKDDPTIRRLINFSKKFNYGGFFVGNLHTHISSNPNKIDSSQNISKKNFKILVRLINSVNDVVYAWGNNTNEPNFLKQIVDSPMCLGKNKDGSPSHPLYLPSNSKLLKFR